MKHINKFLRDYFLDNPNQWLDKSKLELYGNVYGGALRGDISMLRKFGLTIISKKGVGYKLTTNPKEIMTFALKEREKAKQLYEMYNKWVVENDREH